MLNKSYLLAISIYTVFNICNKKQATSKLL